MRVSTPFKRFGIVGIMALLAAALVPAASSAAPYEPNDNIGQATGPLMGGFSYGAALETPNDEDWYVFYTSGQRQLDIAVTSFSQDDSVFFYLLDKDGQRIDQGQARPNQTGHIRYTASRADRFYIQVPADSFGSMPSYALRVDPADALISSLPPSNGGGGGNEGDDNDRCSRARALRDNTLRNVRRVREQLSRARSSARRRSLRRKLRARQSLLFRRQADVRLAC